MNINSKNINKNNYLLLAYENNQNINIIKYLVEDCKMDINLKTIKIKNVYYYHAIIQILMLSNILLNIAKCILT
jgi:hypothetical protein